MSEFSTTFIVAPYSAEDADVLFSLWSAGTVALCDSAQTAGGCTECEGGTIEEIMKAVVKVKTIMKQEDNNIDFKVFGVSEGSGGEAIPFEIRAKGQSYQLRCDFAVLEEDDSAIDFLAGTNDLDSIPQLLGEKKFESFRKVINGESDENYDDVLIYENDGYEDWLESCMEE